MARIRIILIALLAFSLIGLRGWAQDYSFTDLAQVEANYILKCQLNDEASPAYGAINDIYGAPTWVVPRENAMAILGLLKASELLGDDNLRVKAGLCADYLVKIQDKDGGWFNQYNYLQPGSGNPDDKESLAKSPTQTAEVMIALYKLGYDQSRYPAMKKGAMYLMNCQQKGGDGRLLGAGKDSDGNYRTRRWASDNSYAYQALKGAEVWSLTQKDYRFSLLCGNASRKIIKAIDDTLYVKNPYDPDFGVWRRVVDDKNMPVEAQDHDWINYAPQMLDLPCRGVGSPRVGKWIHNKFQKPDGSCAWDDYSFSSRRSPGYSFQAVLCWRKLCQPDYYIPALRWALESGLWQVDPDENLISGGWIDWMDPETSQRSTWWERFIDTSFYSIAAYNGGYDFNIVPAFLRIGYSDPKADADKIPCYLKLRLQAPQEEE